MAFLPEKNYLEEHLANNSSLATTIEFTSSDISNFLTLSLQFTYTSVKGTNVFRLLQSLDGINFSYLTDEFELPLGNGNFLIDKFQFTGKYLKVEFITTESGNITIKLLAKR